MPLELTNDEQVRMRMAESAGTMAGTDFWKALTKAMVVNEANALTQLDEYLSTEPHPDREELMTMALRWHALRTHRRLLMENVEQARNYKHVLKNQVLEQLMTGTELSEDAQAILLEYGEM